MSFLATLAGRALGTVPVLRPRRPSRFEPAGPHTGLQPTLEAPEDHPGDGAEDAAVAEPGGVGSPATGPAPRTRAEGTVRPREPYATSFPEEEAEPVVRAADGPEPTLAEPGASRAEPGLARGEPAPEEEASPLRREPSLRAPARTPSRAPSPPESPVAEEASPESPSAAADGAAPASPPSPAGRSPAPRVEAPAPAKSAARPVVPARTAPAGWPGTPAAFGPPADDRPPMQSRQAAAAPVAARTAEPPRPDRPARSEATPEEAASPPAPAESPRPAAPDPVAEWADGGPPHPPRGDARAAADGGPAVRVTIGRIELRNEPTPPARPKPPRRRNPRLTLDGYLDRRSPDRGRGGPR